MREIANEDTARQQPGELGRGVVGGEKHEVRAPLDHPPAVRPQHRRKAKPLSRDDLAQLERWVAAQPETAVCFAVVSPGFDGGGVMLKRGAADTKGLIACIPRLGQRRRRLTTLREELRPR